MILNLEPFARSEMPELTFHTFASVVFEGREFDLTLITDFMMIAKKFRLHRHASRVPIFITSLIPGHFYLGGLT